MKFYTFYRDSNNFSDILKDKRLKITHTMSMPKKLIIGVDNSSDELDVYISMMYTECIIQMIKDFSPKPGVDYIPSEPANFKEPS